MVTLPTQRVRVVWPRLRRKGGGKGAEVAIPAYRAMQQGAGLQEKLAAILLHGVSTRGYAEVIPAMAETCGVSRSIMSREFIQASEEALRTLCERRFDETEFLIRWFAAACLETEKHFRRIMGYQHLWTLKAKLHELRALREERTSEPATRQGEQIPATTLTQMAA